MAKKKIKKPKFIFVVGGVMSGVGKGVASSSIARILQSRGFNVTAIKIDPYVNVDAGTMNPTEHGEVFVLDDGMECDQDMGNYERFLEKNFTKANYMTTGSIYLSVINKERNLKYKGACVSVVPHIPMEVVSRIKRAGKKDNAEIIITEIGGTVGEYENILFLEAVRTLKVKNPDDVMLIMVSHLPILNEGSELKTKPTQHATRAVNSVGLQPDMVIARAKIPLDKKRKEKIAFHCSMDIKDVISAPDVENIYEVPLNFEKDDVSARVLKKLNLHSRQQDLKQWKKLIKIIQDSTEPVKIGIVGKYFDTGKFVLADSYISVIEAIKHASYKHKCKPIVEWLSAEDYDPQNKNYKKNLKKLKVYNGIVVPGGFGARGIEGKIQTIKFCRENKIPYLGLCYGMQLAVVEYARHVLGLKTANTVEIDPETEYPVIDIMPEQKELMKEDNYGGTMRLGAYPAELNKGSIARKAYKSEQISERHRHRYEVNPEYIDQLKEAGLRFSGVSPDGRLMEIAELSKSEHPFFLGSQFHPEFKSRPLNPHPLFLEFIKAAKG